MAALTVRDARTGTVVGTTYTRAGNGLTVTGADLLAGATYAVRVDYRGRPAPARAPSSREDMSGLGWHTTRTGQVWAMQEPYGAFTWYPVNDHPSDKATYDVRLDVPRKWVGVSNGRMVSRMLSHGRTITRFTSRDPMASYLATVAIGPYERYTQTGPHGIPLTYWIPRDKPQYLAPLKATPATLRFLESRLGPYPFDRAGVVVTPSGSAMETQTMITFGARTTATAPARCSRRSRRARARVVRRHGHARRLVGRVDERGHGDVRRGGVLDRTRLAVGRLLGAGVRPQRRPVAGVYGPPGDYHRDQFAQINVYFCTARMWGRLRQELGAGAFDALVRAGRRSTATRSRTARPSSRGSARTPAVTSRRSSTSGSTPTPPA